MSSFWTITIFVLVLVAWPVWLVRRMKKIRTLGRAIDRAKRDTEPAPQASYVDVVKFENGLSYSRSFAPEDELVAASKRAAEMPDIAKTLEGRK